MSNDLHDFDARRLIKRYNMDGKGKRRVAMSVRVSTEHEQQMNALQNQRQWAIEVASKNKNWIFDENRDLYIEKGLSGTSMKKRPEFARMIEKAKAGEYDLLVVREVCRFMRNARLTLDIVNELLDNGVEVYFVNDNIWTYNQDDYMKLVIMAQYAEQESKKISERVFSGQAVSRENGVLYGNGNILGYKHIKGKTSSETTYIIDEEQAKTVRLIYQMALDGNGIKKIRKHLIDNGYKTATGGTNWYDATIERILRRKTYKGVMEHYQSVTEDPLSHKRIRVDKSQRVDIDIDIPIIIPPDMWDAVQSALDSRTHYISNGKKVGVPYNKDIYCKKLRCGCGRRFKRDYEHKKDASTYRCYQLIDDGSLERRLERSKLLNDNCSVYGVRDWKLDFYSLLVFKSLDCDFSNIKNTLLDIIDKSYKQEIGDGYSEDDMLKLSNEIARIKGKNEKLLDALEEGIICKEDYFKRTEKNSIEISEKQKLLDSIINDRDRTSQKEETLKEVAKYIEKELKFPSIDGRKVKVPEVLIETFVNSIKICADNVVEYNIRINPNAKVDIPVIPDEEFNPQFHSAKVYIDNTDAVLIKEISVSYEDAKNYANKRKKKVKRVHFDKPVTIRVYANL